MYVDRVGLTVAGQPVFVVQSDVFGVVLDEVITSLLDDLMITVCTLFLVEKLVSRSWCHFGGMNETCETWMSRKAKMFIEEFPLT
jgi:hypothetical protein